MERASPRAAATRCTPDQPVELADVRSAQDPAFAGQPQALYTVFVWLQDALGNASGNSGRDQLRIPDQPAAPADLDRGERPGALHDHPRRPRAPGAHHRDQLDGLQQPGVCTPAESSPGLSFVFAPSHTRQFQHSPYGSVHDPGLAAGRRGEHEPC